MIDPIHRRQFMQLGVLAGGSLLGGSLPPSVAADKEEVLYNGIRLPSPWPPKLKELPKQLPTPAYLTAPPSVIPIDLGRQLFVDDFLIDQTTLTRTHHRATYHPKNPVLTG